MKVDGLHTQTTERTSYDYRCRRCCPFCCDYWRRKRAGREIAIGFADKRYRVFGTARTPEEVEDVRQVTHGVADLSVVDITDEAAVRGWAKDTSTR